jgi:hypothetical protein
MINNDLYKQLKEAYSDKNLNNITAGLIKLYKAKQFGSIRSISKIVSEFVTIDDEKINKCFSKLIMLYHPDKGEFYRNEIEKKLLAGDRDGLEQYTHILLIQDIENVTISVVEIEDIDYSPEYEYDSNEDGVNYFSDTDSRFSEKDSFDTFYGTDENTFYNALKIKIYGNIEIEFPSYYLEDMEEVEMADCQIESLEGIEFCIHTITADLSGNRITDISELWNLNSLEELYLANNQIGYIDTLSNLLNLRVIDLSNNEIDDISPLFELENLEFINVAGNKIPKEQIIELNKEGRIVIQ